MLHNLLTIRDHSTAPTGGAIDLGVSPPHQSSPAEYPVYGGFYNTSSYLLDGVMLSERGMSVRIFIFYECSGSGSGWIRIRLDPDPPLFHTKLNVLKMYLKVCVRIHQNYPHNT